MQTFTVYHHSMPKFSEQDYRDCWPGSCYHKVATVTANSLDQVFELTNHIDKPWFKNAGVVVSDSGLHGYHRSTSVGDVIVNDNTGSAHGVAHFGFEPLTRA